jgi:hypothetical protein
VVANAPEIHNRHRVFIVILGDVSPARSPGRHPAYQVIGNEGPGVAVESQAHFTVVKDSARPTFDHLAIFD